jgi:hypothetical protein
MKLTITVDLELEESNASDAMETTHALLKGVPHQIIKIKA